MYRFFPGAPIYPTNVSDNMQCFTNFEPRAELQNDLTSRVVAGLANPSEVNATELNAGAGSIRGQGWRTSIFEEFLDRKIIVRAKERGYLDFKHMLHGNKESGPLSILINVNKKG